MINLILLCRNDLDPVNIIIIYFNKKRSKIDNMPAFVENRQIHKLETVDISVAVK